MNDVIYLASDTVVGPSGEQGTAQSAPASGTSTAASAPAQPDSPMSLFSNPNTQLILTMVVVFAIMYFFTIRPQRKREKELREIQNSIKPGDWVVTFSGMYGKVVDIGTDLAMIEFGTNKGVRIPIRKAEITKASEPVLTMKKEEEGAEKDKQ